MVVRFFLCLFLSVSLGAIAQESEHFRFSIYFPGGRYYITEDQSVKLQIVIDSLYQEGHYDVTIHSHTDDIGGARYNEWLSQMRSLMTKHVLIKDNGLDETVIEIKDFGQYNPLYDNSTAEGRMRNRRVDIIFWPLSL